MKFRAHPITVLSNLKPILFILPLPYLRMAFRYFISGQVGKIGIFTFFAIFMVGFRAIGIYKKIYLYVGEKTIVAQRGFFVTETVSLPIKNVAVITLGQNLLDFALSTATLSIYTEGGKAKKADFRIKLKKSDAEAVLSAVYKEERKPLAAVNKKRLLVTAAATSSALGGLFIVAPVVNRLGKLLGRATRQNLYGKLADFPQKAVTTFPPVINSLSILLAVGFAVSFVYAVLRLFSMRVTVGENRCEVHFGLFVRRQKVFSNTAVKCIVVEKPFIARVLKLCNARLDVGQSFISAESLPLLTNEEYKEIFTCRAKYSQMNREIRPKRNTGAKNRFLFLPTIFLFFVVALAIISASFGGMGQTAVFFTAIVGVMLLYFARIRLFEYKKGRLIFGKTVQIKTTSFLRPREIYAPFEKVGHVIITRLPPDLFKSTCRVRVTVTSKSGYGAALRHVEYKKVQKEMENAYYKE